MEAIMSWYHLLAVPKGLQDSTQARARVIYFQCHEELFLVRGVIGLPEVQKDQEEGVLVYSGELLS